MANNNADVNVKLTEVTSKSKTSLMNVVYLLCFSNVQGFDTCSVLGLFSEIEFWGFHISFLLLDEMTDLGVKFIMDLLVFSLRYELTYLKGKKLLDKVLNIGPSGVVSIFKVKTSTATFGPST